VAKKAKKRKPKRIADAPLVPELVPPQLRPRRALDYDLERQSEHMAVSALRAAAPGMEYLLTRYPRKWLRKDVVAGVAVAAYLVPQVLAYSAIVNVPPVAGLWSALAAIIAYAVMGGSRVLSAGPESTIALMAGAAIAPLAGGDPQRALSLSAALCLVVAGWCLIARVLRAGIVVELLSQPLLVGYLAGGAVLMIVGQLGKVTGTKVSGESIVDQIQSFLSVVGNTKPLTLAVGLSTLALILVVRTVSPALPAPLIAVALATAVSALLGLAEQGVAIVGQVPSGLPMPHLPDVSMTDLNALILAGLGVAVVGYSDNMLIARGFPAPLEEGETKADVRVDPQKELVALAGVQAAIGFFSGYPASSSGSRTALAIASGARSQIYSLAAGLCIIAVLFFAGPLISALPQAALGAVVFYAAGKLVSIPEFRRLWNFRRRELVLAVVTMLGTVIIGILAGVVLAIAISLLEMTHRLARPHEGVLGRVPGLPGMHDVADYKKARTIPGCIFYRYDAPLFFANIGDLRERVENVIAQENAAFPQSPVRWFILNVEANVEVDVTAADGLRELAQELAARGIELGLARVKLDLYEPLDRAGVIDVIGKDMLFATLPVAEKAYLAWATAQLPTAAPAPEPEVVEEAEEPDLLPWERPDDDDPVEGEELAAPPSPATDESDHPAQGAGSAHMDLPRSDPTSPLSTDPGHVTRWP
jgi:SulP family sulfate permease